MKFTYIDLFAGCGGLSLGLKNAGWKGLFAVEKNNQAFATLNHNLISSDHFYWPSWLPKEPLNINSILKKYKHELESLEGQVTLIAGGPPCQGFSTAGARLETDGRNQLVHSYIKFVKIVKPSIVFFENVRGFTFSFNLKKKKKTYSDIVINGLQKLGYNVKANVVDFSDYGVPQKRNRFILVGILNGKENLFFEKLVEIKANFLNSKGLRIPTTIHEAISDLLQQHGEDDSPDTNNFKAGVYGESKTSYQNLMRGSKALTGMIADSHRFTNHKEDTLKIFKEILSKGERNKRVNDNLRAELNIKKRSLTPLALNEPSPVLTSHPDDYIHYSEPRILSVREYARIQSFPDSFEFKEKYTTGGKARKKEVPRYTQVGNAIPPLFAEQAGLALKEMVNE